MKQILANGINSYRNQIIMKFEFNKKTTKSLAFFSVSKGGSFLLVVQVKQLRRVGDVEHSSSF